MNSSTTAFSSDGQEVLSRQVESTLPLGHSTASGKNQKEFRGYFEIARCVEFIKSDAKFLKVKLNVAVHIANSSDTYRLLCFMTT